MEITELVLSNDLARPWVVVACALCAASLLLLGWELARARAGAKGRAGLVFVTGALGALLLLAAVLRPARVRARGSRVGPRVLVLVDASRSMDLPGAGAAPRWAAAERALAELAKHRAGPRLGVVAFGEGKGAPWEPGKPRPAPASKSDLVAAVDAALSGADELPSALVVISDGRLDRPGEVEAAEGAKLLARGLRLHAVPVTERELPDASVRKVLAAGAAVAHQPLSIEVVVGCSGGLACDELPVEVLEHREGGPPLSLARGKATLSGGTGSVKLPVVLDRAGPRILEVAIKGVRGDQLPENDRRFVTLDVARDRVRVLHVAGRPTYDVRALRMWLKSDAALDVVAFFILRTHTDDVHASNDDLALIPFPVKELFEEHLSSFDAVVLQDFDARPYDLSKYLPTLARYVEKGGGLIMVGGADAFVPGHYARTDIARVLPISLDIDPGSSGVDVAPFTPSFTEVGRAAPVLAPLRALVGEDLGEMPGTNLVDDARPGSTVLLVHPSRRTTTGQAMPVLTLGEYGDGRSIALTLDGTHRLAIGDRAGESGGRAHGALWDALLGWLMRDPKYEPAGVAPEKPCVAGQDTTLRVRLLPGQKGELTVKVRRLGQEADLVSVTKPLGGRDPTASIPVGKLEAGAYVAILEIEPAAGRAKNKTKGLMVKRDFACEAGGDEWADSRPDPRRLAAMAQATGGSVRPPEEVGALELPAATLVTAERSSSALLPAWVWTLLAAATSGASWILRRQRGLS